MSDNGQPKKKYNSKFHFFFLELSMNFRFPKYEIQSKIKSIKTKRNICDTVKKVAAPSAVG